MAGPDLPFPNNTRNDGTFLGFRFGRRKRTIFIVLTLCIFFVIWFNSDMTYNNSLSSYLPDEMSDPIIQPDQSDKSKVEQEVEEVEQEEEEQEQEEQTKQEQVPKQQEQQTKQKETPQTKPSTNNKPTPPKVSPSTKSTTVAKLVAQHYKYFIVIGSRAPQSSRRQLIRNTYFGIQDNIEPCMKRDKGLGYVFYVYGDEPTPKTPERRVYETEKMEYNDLTKVNADEFNQDDVLRWATTVLSERGVTFDYLIVQNGYSIVQLNYIQQQIQAEVGEIWRVEKTPTDLVWVSANNNHQTSIVIGSSALQKALEKQEEIKQVSNNVELPLLGHYYEYYRSISIQLKFVTVAKQVERLKAIMKDLPVFIDNQKRFQQWDNVIENLPDMPITIADVYQDQDFAAIAKNLKIGPASLCRVLEKPSIAVVTSSFIYADSCMEPSASLAADNKREYAMKHNYAFVARSNEFAQQELRQERRRTVWGKIDAVQKVLPKYDWIFWMDMDAVIMEQDQSVQGILDDLRNNYEGGAKEFEKNIDLVIAKPKRDKMINAGVFFLRNTEWAQKFLNKVQSTTDWFNHGPSYEQGAMWDIIQLPGYKEHVMLLENDDHTFNTFPTLYVPGDFIVHFAPDKCPGPSVLKGLAAAKRIQQGEFIESLEN